MEEIEAGIAWMLLAKVAERAKRSRVLSDERE
jgi:hypothetical protein